MMLTLGGSSTTCGALICHPASWWGTLPVSTWSNSWTGTRGSPPTIAGGAFTIPSAGRGDANLNDGSGSVNFKYYIVDANNIRFLASDSGIVGIGSAEKQSGTLTLSGSYAFGSKGDTHNFIGGVNSVGRFTS